MKTHRNIKPPSWTAARLSAVFAASLLSLDGVQAQDSIELKQDMWSVSASQKSNLAANAIDNSASSRWSSGTPQAEGQAFEIDLGKIETFDRLILDAGSSQLDYPRAYSVFVSSDATNWGEAIAEGSGDNAVTEITFSPQSARFVRIAQTGNDPFYWWSIHDLALYDSRQPTSGDDSEILDRSSWSLSSDNASSSLANAIDGNVNTRWTTEQSQREGQFLDLDLGQIYSVDEVVIETAGGGQSAQDYPRGLEVLISQDANNWQSVFNGPGNSDGVTRIPVPSQTARYIKLNQTGSDGFHWWSVHELNVAGTRVVDEQNEAPVASFITPSVGQSFIEGDSLTVEVDANDSDGSIGGVDLYLNDQFIRREAVKPYQWGIDATVDPQLQNLSAGSYELSAVAKDDKGATTSISTVLQFLFEDDDPAEENENVVEHTYPKTSGPDKNPLKGWNSGWFNGREEASVGFQYIPWKELEPQNGRFNFANVEKIIARAGSEGRHVALRLYCDWHGANKESRGCPSWIYSQVGVARLRGSNGRYITDYNDPKYVREAIQAINALADRYDDDPRIHSFQLGVIGYWGEWHTFGSSFNGNSYQITRDTESKILNAYRDAFDTVKLVARYPYRSVMAEANDLGFHNDFFKPNNGHSDEFDDAVAAGEKWLNGPIGGEIPPGLSGNDYQALYQTSQGASMIQTGRYSTMKPGDVSRQNFAKHMELHRMMGYNFQIQKALFPELVQQSLPVTLKMKNVGVAPLYYDWQVQFALLDRNNRPARVQIANAHDLTRHLPNASFDLKSNLNLSSVSKGNYRLAVRVIQPNADKRKSSPWKLDADNTYIQFANALQVIEGRWDAQNRLKGGWSVLGEIRVQ